MPRSSNKVIFPTATPGTWSGLQTNTGDEVSTWSQFIYFWFLNLNLPSNLMWKISVSEFFLLTWLPRGRASPFLSMVTPGGGPRAGRGKGLEGTIRITRPSFAAPSLYIQDRDVLLNKWTCQCPCTDFYSISQCKTTSNYFAEILFKLQTFMVTEEYHLFLINIFYVVRYFRLGYFRVSDIIYTTVSYIEYWTLVVFVDQKL